ncbi:MAG: hypothetical protein JWO19_4722 [Bryobacterales bacterium]|jgi:hypothetical protein|nr:hypothetical protein [Bryobacterales bacterium]
MSLPVRAFSARVQLPCRVFCGPDSVLELSGMAVSIDTGSLVLAMPGGNGNSNHHDQPRLGDKVRLELSLPVTERNAGAKYLAVRARVALVTEMLDGTRQIKFTFRKASFKDRVEEVIVKPIKQAGKLWRM